jgi:hypothetical protein
MSIILSQRKDRGIVPRFHLAESGSKLFFHNLIDFILRNGTSDDIWNNGSKRKTDCQYCNFRVECIICLEDTIKHQPDRREHQNGHESINRKQLHPQMYHTMCQDFEDRAYSTP